MGMRMKIVTFQAWTMGGDNLRPVDGIDRRWSMLSMLSWENGRFKKQHLPICIKSFIFDIESFQNTLSNGSRISTGRYVSMNSNNETQISKLLLIGFQFKNLGVVLKSWVKVNDVSVAFQVCFREQLAATFLRHMPYFDRISQSTASPSWNTLIVTDEGANPGIVRSFPTSNSN